MERKTIRLDAVRAREYNTPMATSRHPAASARQHLTPILTGTLILSILSLFLEQAGLTSPAARLCVRIIDFSVAGLILLELLLDFSLTPYKSTFFRRQGFSAAVSLVYLLLFAFNQYLVLGAGLSGGEFNAVILVLLRNFFILFKVYTRFRRLTSFLGGLTVNPAQTLVLSFLMVILLGTLYLMLPFTTADGLGLSFLNALFTASSAVCVTGLIVVDTASHFTPAGQAGILLLIQIGGLGIMILSYSAAFALRRGLKLQDKLLLAYVIDEDDMTRIKGGLFSIIRLTFFLEALGTLFLGAGFYRQGQGPGKALWNGLFHAVSAFCNAGFALFSNSLEDFAGSPLITLPTAALIILGGLSFAVMSNILEFLPLRRGKPGKPGKPDGFSPRQPRLTLNSRLVLPLTAFLILAGTLLFYWLEHGTTLRGLPLGKQYLSAFFQAVTLRTAGFNTLPLSQLTGAALLFMLIWMFIGGASGSTAGGIKVNTAAAAGLFFRSRFRGEDQILVGWGTRKQALRRDTAVNALLLIAFGAAAVAAGFFLLLLTETRGSASTHPAAFMDILFETVSAFGTVGLSRGITSELSAPGKLIISLLMFLGRLGPLTLLSALAQRKEGAKISHGETEIMIG